MKTAIDISTIDKERANIERAVQTIYYNTLRDYIAEANTREVMSNLYNFFKDGDIVIISKPEWQQYLEWQKNMLEIGMLKVN